jgi:hypothetical protein
MKPVARGESLAGHLPNTLYMTHQQQLMGHIRPTTTNN